MPSSVLHVILMILVTDCCLNVYGSKTVFKMPDQMLWWQRAVKHLIPGPMARNSAIPIQLYAGESNVNDPNYEYLIINDEICSNESDIFLVMVVRSVFNQRDRRQAIRDTWANQKLFPKLNIKIVFIFGTVKDWRDQIALVEEHEIYKDIVQQTFTDSYSTLPIKDQLAFKWVYTFCAHAQFAMIGSDEIVVDMFKLVPYLQTYALRETNPKRFLKRIAVCYLFPCCTRVHRSRQYKYSASRKKYPGAAYPQYCSGTAYIAPTAVIERLLSASVDTPMFMPDDAWIGVLAEKAEISLEDTYKSFTGISNKPTVLRDFNNTHYLSSPVMIGVLDYDFPNREAEMIRYFWRMILRHHSDKMNSSSLWVWEEKITIPTAMPDDENILSSLITEGISYEFVMIGLLIIFCFLVCSTQKHNFKRCFKRSIQGQI
ncbi:beta-1,3-galactosyltransferase 5-like [Tubulanus polymorphus]|uniref:beta-1,3-galactosyltransferase 5-like n=1 Tax=Tubulanus polymorphus TaxID=672921 RepID=UPI003DA23AA2